MLHKINVIKVAKLYREVFSGLAFFLKNFYNCSLKNIKNCHLATIKSSGWLADRKQCFKTAGM
jgi:hypothetical protein